MKIAPIPYEEKYASAEDRIAHKLFECFGNEKTEVWTTYWMWATYLAYNDQFVKDMKKINNQKPSKRIKNGR